MTDIIDGVKFAHHIAMSGFYFTIDRHVESLSRHDSWDVFNTREFINVQTNITSAMARGSFLQNRSSYDSLEKSHLIAKTVKLRRRRKDIVAEIVVREFRKSQLFKWLEDHQISDYTLNFESDRLSGGYIPSLQIRFENKDHALLYKLTWHSA